MWSLPLFATSREVKFQLSVIIQYEMNSPGRLKISNETCRLWNVSNLPEFTNLLSFCKAQNWRAWNHYLGEVWWQREAMRCIFLRIIIGTDSPFTKMPFSLSAIWHDKQWHDMLNKLYCTTDMSNTTFFTPIPIPNIFKEALTIPNTNTNFMTSP